MASESTERSVTNTLTSTTADEITLTNPWPAIEVTNHDASTTLYVRMDGVTAVSEANGAIAVLPSSSKVIRSGIRYINGGPQIIVSIVGNGNKYTIEGVN